MKNLNNYQAIVRRIQHFTVSVESPSDFPADAVDAALEFWGSLSSYVEDMEPDAQEMRVMSVSKPIPDEEFSLTRRVHPDYGSLMVSKVDNPHGVEDYTIVDLKSKS